MTATTDTLRPITTASDIPTTLDKFLTSYSVSGSGTLINTTSTSFTNYTGASLTVTLTANQIIELNAVAGFSHSNSGQTLAMRLYEGANALGQIATMQATASNTAGCTNSLQCTHIYAPGAGSFTFTIKWGVSANTGYSLYYMFTAKTFLNV